MYTKNELDMVKNIFSVATVDELEDSYFALRSKDNFDEKKEIENSVINELKIRAESEAKRLKMMEPEYYSGA